MAHWQTMFDPGEFIGNWDLPTGEDTIVTISKVECRQLGNKGTKEKKPIIMFDGSERGLVGNKTNCKTISALYGTDCEQWIGKSIALFSTQCEAFGEMVDCIRVRPEVPTKLAVAK